MRRLLWKEWIEKPVEVLIVEARRLGFTLEEAHRLVRQSIGNLNLQIAIYVKSPATMRCL